MEIVEVFVEYPSGMTISDRATYVRDLEQVCVSDRLAAVLREVSVSEAPPEVTATIGGATVSLHQCVDGCFAVAEVTVPARPVGLAARVLQPFLDPTKDQQQQFGRFCHTLATAAFLGAVGVWHSTQQWTLADIKLEASLVMAFVITFVRGMLSMKGE